MTHIKDAKPEKLTAEQALYRKAMSGPLEPEENLRLSVILADDTGQFEAAYDDVVAVLDTLDASRAETEAVRLELDRTEQSRKRLAALAFLDEGRTSLTWRDLAAELVEGLEWATDNLHKLARLHWKGGDPDWNDVRRCRDLLARARAQGIGGEKAGE